MARRPQPATKSETLSIRLDPKTRFILEYLSRIRGQTITTIVERAIVSAASAQKIEDKSQYGAELGWEDFWDVSEGVRALKMAEESEFFPTYEEEKRWAFAKYHWPFFWTSEKRIVFLNHYVDILWPRIDEFVRIHDDSKAQATDHHAAAKAMTEVLKGANLEPPQWPPKVVPASGGGYSRALGDDEIPF